MRVLVADDEKQITRFLQKTLEQECFIVDIAENGTRAEFLALTNDYDIIIIDNIMPDKTGPEVCKKLREKGKTVPIIMLSAVTAVPDKIHALNIGADDYITKPFSFQELLARMRALLRRPKIIQEDILQIENIILNKQTHEVTVDNKLIYLTKKEFSLLEYLMQNSGIVLSRGMILEHVWDMNADPFSNTIETHIGSLRKKLNDIDKEERLIYTIPGRGYKFKA